MKRKKTSQFGINQGEGDRDAARHYNDAAHAHAKRGNVAREAEDAKTALKDSKAREELKRAELIGKRHAKEEDPEIRRDYSRGK